MVSVVVGRGEHHSPGCRGPLQSLTPELGPGEALGIPQLPQEGDGGAGSEPLRPAPNRDPHVSSLRGRRALAGARGPIPGEEPPAHNNPTPSLPPGTSPGPP